MVRPAFSYYGGKQRMAPKIIPLIPPHAVYVEPFAGGAAVFFKKPWPDVTHNDTYREVLNDTDSRIVNFYRVLRDHGEELCRRIELTPYSKEEYALAGEPCDDPIEAARRWFVDIRQSFANKSRGGWGRNKAGYNSAATWANSTPHTAADRLASVYVEHADALECIRKWDSPQTFFYCDPPYPETDQGHYDGYTQDDFAALVDKLDGIKGSFLLSCYDNEAPHEGWERFDFNHNAGAANGKNGAGKGKRTEVVWRKIGTEPWHPSVEKVRHKFDCFKGAAQSPKALRDWR